MKLLILTLLLAGSTALGAGAAVKGYVVFSRAQTQFYEFAPDGSLRLTASAPARDPGDHIACAGWVFGIESLLGRIYRLSPDLKEDRAIELGKIRDVARLVGADADRIYVFFDNTLAAFDAELKPAGRVTLEPEKHGDIVPVVSVDAFAVFADKAHLLTANTGDVFTVDLKTWTAQRTRLPGEGARARAQWIDPGDQTLNVLVSRIQEEHTPELDAGETRVIKSEVVLTYDLRIPGAPPRETVIHDAREIHKPYSRDSAENLERLEAKGVIVEFPPPYHEERPAQGLYVSEVSATTPCFAQVFVESQKQSAALGSRELVILGSGGKTTGIERFRDEKHDVIWFRHGGDVRILAPDIRKNQLNVQTSAYLKLLDLPGTAGVPVLAY